MLPQQQVKLFLEKGGGAAAQRAALDSKRKERRSERERVCVFEFRIIKINWDWNKNKIKFEAFEFVAGCYSSGWKEKRSGFLAKAKNFRVSEQRKPNITRV